MSRVIKKYYSYIISNANDMFRCTVFYQVSNNMNNEAKWIYKEKLPELGVIKT